MTEQTILLVEDDDSFRTSLRKVLKRENYRVLEAANGQEGNRLTEGQKIDLIILDYYLEDMTGLDFLKRMQGKILPPVMVLSANTNPKMEQEVQALGTQISLNKPINRQDLLEAVKQTIRNGERYDGA